MRRRRSVGRSRRISLFNIILNMESSSIMQREMVEVEKEEDGDQILSVYQWNILADSLAYNFSNVPDEDLKWTNRAKLIEKAF